MTSFPGLTRRLNQTASTKRRVKTGSKFTEDNNLTGVKCSAPYPISPEIQNRLGLDTPHELLEIFTKSADIRPGDVLVLNGSEYPIRSVSRWPLLTNKRFLRLIVEDLKV